jgi:hypothetical protein
MMIDAKAKLMAVLDNADEYLGLAIRAEDRGERESYARVSWSCTGRSLTSLRCLSTVSLSRPLWGRKR